MLLKAGPSPDSRIQRIDPLLLICGFRFLENVPDFREEGIDVLLRRRDQKLAAFVLSDLLSQENEPFRDVHDSGLLLREFKTAFLQELRDEGWTFFSRSGFDAPVITKSSAYLTK